MRFTKEGYLFTQEEIDSLEIVEINGIKKYLIKFQRTNNQAIDKELLEKNCKELSSKSAILRELNISTFILNKYLNKYFGTIKLGEIKQKLNQI